MPTYSIQRWDPIIASGNIYANPVLFFKPDDSFRKYAKENGYKVSLRISGTGLYDKVVTGVVDSSDLYPNERPNYYNVTGYWIITAMTEWLGYPKSMGTFSVGGVSDSVTEKTFTVPRPIGLDEQQAIEKMWDPRFSPSIRESFSLNSEISLTTNQIYTLLVFFAIAFLLAIYFVFFRKNEK